MEDRSHATTVSHQYDYLNCKVEHAIESPDIVSAANVFTAEQDETLTSVGAKTVELLYDFRMNYAIYRLREGATSPVDGELLDTVSCLYAYPGYHREPLEAPIPLKRGDRFSVVVTQTLMGEGGKTNYAICATSAFTEKGAKDARHHEYGKAVVNRGESWAYVDGRWQDWTDVLAADPEANPSEKAVDNVGIKAFARTAESGAYRWTECGGQSWTRGSHDGSTSRSGAPSTRRTRPPTSPPSPSTAGGSPRASAPSRARRTEPR